MSARFHPRAGGDKQWRLASKLRLAGFHPLLSSCPSGLSSFCLVISLSFTDCVIFPSLSLVISPYHNPFSVEESAADKVYPYPYLKPVFPTDISMEPYKPIYDFVDRGTFADKSKSNLLSACSEVDNLQVNIGTELKGLNLRDLTPTQKDELALLVAERGVVVLRKQDLTPEELVEFGKYFGAKERPLHTHPSSGVPRQRGLDQIHVVWHDESMRPSENSYTKTELWHTDVVSSLSLFTLLFGPSH